MNQRFRATDAVDPPGPGDEHPPPHDRVRGGRSPMLPAIVGGAAGFLLLLTMTLTVRGAVRGAAERLEKPAAKNETAETKVAIADNTEAPYCTPGFKTVLQRVLNACGLVGGETRRGCQPADVKTFASISDDDFNALFTPLKDRGAVIMFDDNSDALDADGKKMLEERWLDRKGARYFFVVARASKSGTAETNRALSHKRANSVLLDLNEQFHDPDLDKQVGLLWLGSEFAQLGKEYCEWPISRKGKPCAAEAINRSAFASWVDCRL
jgi:outer membrane protein OmpA-like peptidoglycan-associated protein